MKSMTAFAGAEREIEGWAFAWEIRSVNHRYLDIALRLPEALRFLEGEVRGRIGQSVKRGRIDISLAQKKAQANEAGLQFDHVLLGKLLAATADVEALNGKPLSPFTALDLLRWPGVLREADADRDKLAAPLLELLAEALDKLVAERGREGRLLADLIETRCVALRGHIAA
ncbi:MAG: YicC/YloC family endoribonuclease, partial [Candidatus Methylumidiphilus sp.]